MPACSNSINKILELKSENKKIIAKSCPARAVVLLNYCELNYKHLGYIAEQPTSLKLDYYVPGTKLKIVSDDILNEEFEANPAEGFWTCKRCPFKNICEEACIN